MKSTQRFSRDRFSRAGRNLGMGQAQPGVPGQSNYPANINPQSGAPASSTTQYQRLRSPRSNPMVSFLLRKIPDLLLWC